MEPECSSPHLQKRATGPYPQADKFRPQVTRVGHPNPKMWCSRTHWNENRFRLRNL